MRPFYDLYLVFLLRRYVFVLLKNNMFRLVYAGFPYCGFLVISWQLSIKNTGVSFCININNVVSEMQVDSMPALKDLFINVKYLIRNEKIAEYLQIKKIRCNFASAKNDIEIK